MAERQWDRIQTLFEAVLDVPRDEREQYLATHCEDPAVQEEVASLLSAREEAPNFFSQMADRVVAPLMSESPEIPTGGEDVADVMDLSGRQIGPYRLVEEVGVGGMGIVYRAERVTGDFEQTVAIKLLQRRLHSEAAVERFRTERQVLASLEHPNVAGLIDGGVTEGGRPYLVMEHVDGQFITTYAEERELNLAARLDLLEQVVDAVSAAHGRLVVHRDLKPSNVLVTETESGPTIKLLDFGIAKLLDDSLPVTRPNTRTGQHLMTPAYAAPEQVKGEEITTATDVYQLGVLTYELLTGTRPFELEGKSLTEIERVLIEESPAVPSEEAQGDAGVAGESLQGDLDTIVLKALRKEPERRYRSVGALARDLRRYRAGEPIEARPSTLRYRARKFVERNRTGVVAGIIIAILGVAYAGTVTLQADRLAEQKERAQREAETAEEVSDLLVGLFEASNPYEQPSTLTAETLLRRGEERVSQLQDQPASQAQLLGAIGRAYQGLGEYGRADSFISRAREIRSRLYDGPHPEVAESLDNYGEVQRNRGRYAVAESLHAEALAMRRRLFDPPHPKIAESLHDLGLVKRDRELLSPADSLLRAALSMRRAVHDDPHRTIAVLYNDLGIVLDEQGRYAAADSIYRKALALKRKRLGPQHPSTATTLSNLGNALIERGRYAAADSVFRDALAVRRETLGPRHPETAVTLNSLGLTLREQGRYEAADSVFRDALAIAREQLGPRHPKTATTLNNLGITYYSQGRYAAADSVYRDVLSIDRERLGPRHPDVASTLVNLGSALRMQGRYAAADSAFREALAIRREALGPQHPETATALLNLGSTFRKQGRYERADSLYRRGLAIRREQLGANHVETAGALNRLGLSMYEQGRYEVADSLFHEALAIRREALGPRHPETITILNNLAGVLYRQGRYAATDSIFRKVLALRREKLGPRHPRTARTLSNLATVLSTQEKYAAAEQHLLDLLSIRRSTYRSGHPALRESIQKLVDLYEAWDKSIQAQRYRDSLKAEETPAAET